MKLRLATAAGVPLFDHEGMVLTEKWAIVDTDALKPGGPAAIVKYRGPILQVHPEDVAVFDAIKASVEAETAKATKSAKK